MNVFQKTWCRAFQFVFWAVYPILPYREPKLIEERTEGISATLKSEGKKRPLVITDKGIMKVGLQARIEENLKKNNIDYVLYGDVVANPTTAIVDEALKLYIESGCDSLIGIGGGSSMDTAKAVGARIARPKKSLGQMKGILKVRKQIPLLIAIPTTAGTGSETTLAAVIVDAETRHKYAINDFPLIPRYAVLDPELTRSLPPSITASTGMDALTHAVEAYIGKSNHRMTKIEAKVAVRLVFSNLEKAYADGGDMTARANMLRASYLAGCSFTRSYVGYVHAIAHSLGGKYNIPHGLANAIILPYLLEAYGEKVYGKLKKLAVAANIADELTDEKVAANAFISEIKRMNKVFNIPEHIPEIKEEDIPEMAKHAAKEGNPLYPVPVLMNAKELEKFYYIVKG